MTELERKFTCDMEELCRIAKKECGYNPVRFHQLMSRIGAVAAAKQLITKPGGTEGFTTLWMHKWLDLSIEAHVLKPEYQELFTEEERRICEERLTEMGYDWRQQCRF